MKYHIRHRFSVLHDGRVILPLETWLRFDLKAKIFGILLNESEAIVVTMERPVKVVDTTNGIVIAPIDAVHPAEWKEIGRTQ